jgi:hypothetical protein
MAAGVSGYSRDLVHALIAAVALAAASTIGDMLWAGLSVRHRMAYGLVHGAIICLLIGAFIGWRARRLTLGVVAGPAIGVLAAASFYALASWMRYWAMFPSWMFFWICFGLLQRFLQRGTAWLPAVVRGVVAAVLSGAAFYGISGIWTDPPAGGPNYLYNFGAWTVAFLPGFLALFAGPVDRRK